MRSHSIKDKREMQDEHDFLSFYLSISRLGVKLILVNENKIYIRVEFSSPLV